MQAVRQVLALAQGDATPVARLRQTAEGPLDGATFTVTLEAAEAAALNALAERLACTNGTRTRCLLQMLTATKGGAMPMHKPMKASPLIERGPASASAARLNLSKDRLIIDRLHFILEWGLDESSRAALKELESLETIPPF